MTNGTDAPRLNSAGSTTLADRSSDKRASPESTSDDAITHTANVKTDHVCSNTKFTHRAAMQEAFDDTTRQGDTFNVVILGMKGEETQKRKRDIAGLVFNLRKTTEKKTGQAVVYLVDKQKNSKTPTQTIAGVGENITVKSYQIKHQDKPQLLNVAEQLGIVGQIDAALSDWSAPSFEWSVPLLGQTYYKTLRHKGVVYIRHVHRQHYTETQQKRMKMTLMSGGAYPQHYSQLTWFHTVVATSKELAKRFQILEEHQLPKQFILHHPQDDVKTPSPSLFQYIRIQKM